MDYVVVIAARNEESTIGITLECLAKQTLPPGLCIVASDGSTDRTDAIVLEYQQLHSWIQLQRITRGSARSFASKVSALNSVLRKLHPIAFSYIALLDADIRFAPEYVESLLRRLEASPTIGIAGGLVVDIGTSNELAIRVNPEEVAGASMFIRRACLDAIGPLPEIPEGGFDTVSLVMARMHGYETVTYKDLVVDHLKPRSFASGGVLRRFYAAGRRDYAVGNHPLFQLAKCLSRLLQPPILLGAIARAAGYTSSAAARRPRIIPSEVVDALRSEQLRRMTGSRRKRPT